jgi:hypothetical protein
LVESFANSSSQSLTTLVTVFKAFELVVNVFCQAIGHSLTARDYFSVGHDLPQVVFDRFVHVAIVVACATVISMGADLNLLMTTSNVATSLRSALLTSRARDTVLRATDIGSTTRFGWRLLGHIALAVRRLGVQEVGRHTNLS